MIQWIRQMFCKQHDYKLDTGIVSVGFLDIYSCDRCTKCGKVILSGPVRT